ncbi:uncharacterized protein LOC131231532 isoform X2 [Magnolia sinica]|uniref:uncharacterized protein LOC131231532 isoform X2 n=1 Tax=Magnolia sinica TaxID=86752 RepID=UPI0026599E6C|nr:uncharacterized protein LOC131231532 isoform X2 [Magnolia sinica]
MAAIKVIMARHIFDSRGNRNIEVNVCLSDGTLARAVVTSGALTGLLGDIFSLIHNILETRVSVVIAGKCLRLLVFLNTMSHASECQEDVMGMLGQWN